MTAQPDRVKVRCANPQPTLAGPCGGPVTQAERDRARDLLGPPTTEQEAR